MTEQNIVYEVFVSKDWTEGDRFYKDFHSFNQAKTYFDYLKKKEYGKNGNFKIHFCSFVNGGRLSYIDSYYYCKD